jgi:hypothetical protein
MVRLGRIPKCHDKKVNQLAQGALGYRPILTLEMPANDWRKEIVGYLKDPSKEDDKRLRANQIGVQEITVIIDRQFGIITSNITKDIEVLEIWKRLKSSSISDEPES